MSADNLLSLAERVEMASAPDRELDNAIVDAFSWRNDSGVPIPPGFVGLPAYTASLDHAMTLIPPNCGYVVRSTIGKPPVAAIQFENTDGLPPFSASADGWSDWSKGQTPALAVCAAALRSRAYLTGAYV